MQCANCEQRWPNPTDEDYQRIWDATAVICSILRKQEVPLAIPRDNPLFLFDGIVACCNEPGMIWGRENNELDKDSLALPTSS